MMLKQETDDGRQKRRLLWQQGQSLAEQGSDNQGSVRIKQGTYRPPPVSDQGADSGAIQAPVKLHAHGSAVVKHNSKAVKRANYQVLGSSVETSKVQGCHYIFIAAPKWKRVVPNVKRKTQVKC